MHEVDTIEQELTEKAGFSFWLMRFLEFGLIVAILLGIGKASSFFYNPLDMDEINEFVSLDSCYSELFEEFVVREGQFTGAGAARIKAACAERDSPKDK